MQLEVFLENSSERSQLLLEKGKVISSVPFRETDISENTALVEGAAPPVRTCSGPWSSVN